MDLIDVTLNQIPMQVSLRMTAAGVPHGFTTRQGGVSEGIYSSLNLGLNRGDDREKVLENYRRVCDAFPVDINKLVLTVQVHEDAVRQVTAEDWGKGLDRPQDYRADGLITNVPGTTLVAFGADCLTALLYDPVHRAIGAVHAGWRGTAKGILARAVEAMTEAYGTRPGDLLAALGPCISACCFETNEDVPNAMTAALGGDALPFIREKGEGKFLVDLKGLNALWLTRSGVPEAQIDRSPDCTLCKPDKYWSHRYTKGERGSQASLISLPENR